MAQNLQIASQQRVNEENKIITPDEEIKQLKEYISQIYFKESLDRETKEELLNEIQQLEYLKLDDDFYYHLFNIYEQVIQRQDQNLKEFKEYSSKIEEQRKQIDEKDQQIISILDEHTKFKLDGIKANLKIIDNQFNQLENDIFISHENLNQHIQQICQTVKKTKEEFDKSIQNVSISLQTNSEYIKKEKESQEEKKQKIIEYKQQQEELKEEMRKNEYQLDKICEEMKKQESQQTKDYNIQQLQRENQLLVEKRLQLDSQLAKKRLEFDVLLQNNQIVEKRQALLVQEFASNFIKGRQRDQLKSEVERMTTEYNELRQKVSITQENTQKINSEISSIRKKKVLKTNMTMFLIIVIIMIIFTIFYKFY